MDPELKALLDGIREELMNSVAAIGDEQKAITERLDNAQKVANRPGAAGAGAAGMSPLEAAERKALNDYARSPNPGLFRPTAELQAELKAMLVGSDPDGGYTVMPNVSTGMTKRIFDQSPMRRLADVQTITQGDSWEEPLDDDDIGSAWVSETEDRPDTSTPQVGMLRVPVYEQYAMPRVTQNLLEDSSWDVGAYIEAKGGDRFGRQEGIAFISGDGVKKPRGLLSFATSPLADLAARPRGALQYITSGNATLVTPDALRRMVWTLRSPYRQGASWLMNSNTAGAIDLFKDSQGQYLWRTGMTAGAQNSLLGYPVEIDENMPDVGAGTYPIAFGNFKLGYLIVDKLGLRLLVDPYTSKPWVKFYMRRRVGGSVRNFDAIKLMQVSA